MNFNTNDFEEGVSVDCIIISYWYERTVHLRRWLEKFSVYVHLVMNA